MESFPEWAARYYEAYSAPYLPTTKEAQDRAEQGLPKVLKHLPRKGSKVLDLCCGAGTYLFAIERAGYKMTGLDIQRRMIEGARRFAKTTGSKATLVVGNAMAPKFPDESFDAVVFLGAPFGHFSIAEYGMIARQAFRMLKRKGTMVAEVNDHVALFLSGMYQRVLYEPAGTNDALSIHTRYDGQAGTFNRLFLDLETKKRFKGSFHIWTPWIMDYVMKSVGFAWKVAEPATFGHFTQFVAYSKP